jgi:hypothetical protein
MLAQDLKKASELADSNPEAALSLLEKHPLATEPEPLDERLQASDLRAALYDRCGRHEDAVVERSEATTVREGLLEDIERELASPEERPDPERIEREADLLEDLGRRTEAARCRLFAADLVLAKGGNVAAKARLAGLPWGGIAAAVTLPALGAAQGAGAGLESAEAFGAGYRWGTGEEQGVRDQQEWLVREGRAIGLGRCEHCGHEVEAKIYPNGITGVCAAGHYLTEAGFVLMEDAPPGFYTDPWGRFPQRRWDGNEWTSQVSGDGSLAEDPPGENIPTRRERFLAVSAEYEWKPLKVVHAWRKGPLKEQKEWTKKDEKARREWQRRGRNRRAKEGRD